MRYGKIKKMPSHGGLTRCYYVRVADGDRRTWRSTGQTTLALAKEVVETWRYHDARGDRSAPAITVAASIEAWLATKRGRLRPRTIETYTSYTKKWRAAWGARKLDTLTTDHLSQHLGAASRTRSACSLNLELRVLRVWLRWCVAEGFITVSPATRISRWREPERAIRELTDADELRLLESARRQGEAHYGYVLCLITTGFRRRTVRELEWADVDLEAGVWHIPGERLKSGRPYAGRPINSDLLAWLRAHRRAGGRIFAPMTYMRWARITALAGLPGLGRHDLRRNFVTRIMRQTRDPKAAMWLSDHRDVKIVAAAYWREDREEAKIAIEKLLPGGTPCEKQQRRQS